MLDKMIRPHIINIKAAVNNRTLPVWLLTLWLVLLPLTLNAAPWFTGSLLSLSGKAIPPGHIDIEPYIFDTHFRGFYNNSGHVERRPDFRSTTYAPYFFFGIAENIDGQLVLQYTENLTLGRHGSGISDTVVGIGYQLLNSNTSNPWLPDARFNVQFVVPTGKFDHLSLAANGVEGTGLGVYQTALQLNISYLYELLPDHFLRTRLNLAGIAQSHARIHGRSVYGGGIETEGRVNSRNQFFFLGSMEYTVTQHLVPVFELYYQANQPITFSGNPGLDASGGIAQIEVNSGYQLSIAPALEYNISKDLGIIAGVWYTLKGKNSSQFTSVVIALNYFF